MIRENIVIKFPNHSPFKWYVNWYCVNAYAEDKSKIAVAEIFSNRFCKKIEKVRPHNPIFKPVIKKTKSCIFSGGKEKAKS